MMGRSAVSTAGNRSLNKKLKKNVKEDLKNLMSDSGEKRKYENNIFNLQRQAY